jgi:nitroreductase
MHLFIIGKYMLKNMLESRFTAKWWDNKLVNDEDISNIIDAAYNAPSKQGNFDYLIYVITDSEEGKKFKEYMYWENTYCIDGGLYNRDENSGKMKRFNGQVLAPVLMIWLAKKFDNTIGSGQYYENDYSRTMNDCIVSSTMALCQAEELGLQTGFCGCIKGQEAANKLGQPNYFAVISLGIGYATVSDSPVDKDVYDKNGLKVGFDLANVNPNFKNNDRRNKRLPKNKETFIKYI